MSNCERTVMSPKLTTHTSQNAGKVRVTSFTHCLIAVYRSVAFSGRIATSTVGYPFFF